MDNSQFRKLMFDKNKAKQDGSPSGAQSSAAPSNLGGKKSSFMPMTPRTVKGGIDVDFARQVRERNAGDKPAKKFNSYVPKGSKFAAGYTDRAKAREEAAGEDDKAERIKALEEHMKLGQIEPETFAALRDQITGGDISNTHLVKGLDFQLLNRVRRGENVLGSGEGEEDKEKEPSPDVDDELDKVAEKDVEAVKREKTEKKGTMAAPPPVAGVKRTRAEILAEMKAQRKAAAEVKTANLMDGRWKKVGEKEKSRVEIDHKGREVMITVDEDGVVKKKVRKLPTTEQEDAPEMPDTSKQVLGADVVVPERGKAPAPEEDSDDDIFAGAGTEYNPLGDEDDDDDDSDDDDDEPAAKKPATAPASKPTAQPTESDKDDESGSEAGEIEQPRPVAPKRNYFNDTPEVSESKSGDRFAGIESVLKKAARLDPLHSGEKGDGEGEEGDEAREARLKKRAAMLAQNDRDLEDMDMGFGGSRLEDEADGEGGGEKIRLSEWKGTAGWDDDDDGGGDGKGGKGGGDKKKRKPKKRKGDVNNAADIMRVIEGRKQGGK